ncbi:hypothetical protein BN1708_000209 [Verticillium longisporum]|uniref:Uncharacterized protein n=1 Tax=Verticillium longisporum TaxID=100787 RepID=A0A0G4KDR0_VERLO|nr:hypothetical protein BN1708_000209 [Verticillium longisporum]
MTDEMRPPSICATKRHAARTGVMARTSSMASVTAGLNRPPLMRKKIHTLTMREKPNATEMYMSTPTSKPVVSPVVVLLSLPPESVTLDRMLATSVPAKAKKRNMVVPTNSPIEATKWFLTSLFIHCVQGRRITSARSSRERAFVSFVYICYLTLLILRLVVERPVEMGARRASSGLRAAVAGALASAGPVRRVLEVRVTRASIPVPVLVAILFVRLVTHAAGAAL